MKTLIELTENKSHASFTFGRFNPPTTGHEKLIQALARQGGDMFVYPSHSQDPKKNPLQHSRKIAYMKKMFPRYAKNIIASKSKNVFQIASDLHDKGYENIIMVVGSDRVEEFKTLLKKYNGVKGVHGFYDFKNIDVVSAGERDPDAEGVTGMSASKMRAAAVANDFDSFEMGLPKGFKDGKKLFNDIRKSMNVNETNWSTEEILRDLYIRGEVFNINEDVQTTDGFEGKIVRKGTNYVVLETNGEFKKVWITDLIEQKKITKTKQAKGEVGDVKGTQPAKYYSKDAEGDAMSKDTALARAKYFAKGGSRKDAPGDIDPKTGERQKTKPSQYTKKFKQMYGENTLAKDLNIDPKDVDKLKQLMIIYTRAMKIPSGSPKHKAFQREIERLRKELKMDESAWEKIKEQDKKEPAKSDQEKEREEFKKLQKDKKIAQLQYRMAKDAEMVARLSQQERKLTDAEKDKMKKYEKDIDIKDFIDRYGEEEGKSIYYATITKMAKGESLWANIHKKRQRIKRGSGERMRKKGEKGAPTAAQMKRAKGESVNEMTGFNVPELIKTTIHRLTHPKGYKDLITKYIQRVKDEKGKSGHQDSNGAILSDISREMGFDRIRPIQMYVNKLVRKGQLPQTLAAEFEKEGEHKQTALDNQLTHSNESRGYFTRTKSQSSKGKKLVSVVGPDIKKKLKGIDHKIEPDSTGTQIILTVNKSDVENVKKLVGLPNMVKVVSENPVMIARGASALSKISPSTAAGVVTAVGQGLSKLSKGKTTSSKSRKQSRQQLKDELLDEKIAGLVNKSEKTGVPYSILKKSYDRGMAAWKGGHRPGTTQQQWAFARVNSMLTGGKADPDLQAQIKKGGYKKKKKAKKESVEEWYLDNETRMLYKERYGAEWEEKLNNTYERMLSKLDENDCSCYDHVITEAEYQGKKVKLNDPIRTSENPNKKFKVYVKNEKGKVVVVRFGDPNMAINRDDPERRKSFRARHNCDDPGPKYKARYWSCFQWRAGAKVDN